MVGVCNLSTIMLTVIFATLQVLGSPASPPSPPLAIQVFDDNGDDITAQSEVNIPAVPLKLSKRAQIPIRCDHVDVSGVQYTTFSSFCRNRAQNNQDWTCESWAFNQIMTLESEDGSCAPDEICVDGIQVPQAPYPVAFCASTGDLVSLVLTLNPKVPTKKRITVTNRGVSAPNNAMEAVFSFSDAPSHGITLPGINIQDQGSGAQVLAQNSCSQCSSLGIQPIPAGTLTWQIIAQMPAGTGSAKMWLNFV